MKPNIFFINGKYLPENKTFISVNDLGLQRGYGVFDVLRTYNDKPFLLDKHLDRLFSSAKAINLTIPYSKKEIRKYILDLQPMNKHNESLIKIIVTGGDSDDGITPNNKATVIITDKQLPPTDNNIYCKGMRLITHKYLRNIPPVKSLNYIELIKNKKLLDKKRAYTLLYIHKNKVLEGATCNIFLIKNSIIKTPRSNILNGITRQFVISLINDNFKNKIIQGNISLKELVRADEVFITSTTKGVVPVVSIDNNKIGNGKPGEITKRIINKFDQYTSKN